MNGSHVCHFGVGTFSCQCKVLQSFLSFGHDHAAAFLMVPGHHPGAQAEAPTGTELTCNMSEK